MSNHVAYRYSAEDFHQWSELRAATRPHFEQLYAHISPRLEDAEQVLDLAGGEGHTHDMLPALSSKLVTVDIDGSALARLKDEHPSAQVVEASVGQMPFADESFDAAVGINAINRTDARNQPEEIVRILKPGGKLIFLNDLPFDLGGSVRYARDSMPAEDVASRYDLPIINPSTRAIDQTFSVTRRSLELLTMVSGDQSGQTALKTAETLLRSEDWMEEIYGNLLRTAAYAKLFTRLLAEFRAVTGDEVSLWEPYAPRARQQDLASFSAIDAVSATVEIVELEHETTEVHHIEGEPVSRLFVDELAYPHIITKPDATSTKVKGKTPVFTVEKK